jgi:hypothetical protein
MHRKYSRLLSYDEVLSASMLGYVKAINNYKNDFIHENIDKNLTPYSRTVGEGIAGVMMSSTSEPTIFPNAPPITTPMAMSITFPLTAKALNSDRNPIIFILVSS